MNGRPAKLATQPIGSGPHTTLNYWLWEVVKADKAESSKWASMRRKEQS